MYREFDVKIDFSIQSKNARGLEKYFLEKYPKNFILEKEIGVPYGYFDDFSGLTEWYKPTPYERKQILKEAYRLK
jgi:hypothetical protein